MMLDRATPIQDRHKLSESTPPGFKRLEVFYEQNKISILGPFTRWIEPLATELQAESWMPSTRD